MPNRIQRCWTRGWRKPAGAVYVGRGTKWGNPLWLCSDGLIQHWRDWRWYATGDVERVSRRLIEVYSYDYAAKELGIVVASPEEVVVACYRALLDRNPGPAIAARRELRGKDLMCWCPLTYPDGRPYPCHADVLLEIANAEEV